MKLLFIFITTFLLTGGVSIPGADIVLSAAPAVLKHGNCSFLTPQPVRLNQFRRGLRQMALVAGQPLPTLWSVKYGFPPF
ncbi:hypothetical protein [Escherichia coli]|uniref:hypothetical protein n=1 Tax=Escherichia coli TaxID=562 RepID=UPI0012FDFE03|nr:hypothetical protein [Escherichia coli]QGY11411.1 hypothetical protein F6P95_05375 [Escherichia coli]